MSARMANLLASLDLPAGSRIAVQVEKSVEALMLYLATLRAGHVFLPLNTAYQSAEIEYFIGNAEPAVVVCTPGNAHWVAKVAAACGTQHVFTLGEAQDGNLLEQALRFDDVHAPAPCQADDLAAILYTSGTTGRSKGRCSRMAICSRTHSCSSSTGLAHARAGRRRADPRLAYLPCARAVRRHPRRADQWQQDHLDGEIRRQGRDRRHVARHRVHGRADAVCADAGRADPDQGRPAGCGCSSPAPRRC